VGSFLEVVVVTKSQTLEEIHMNKSVLSIALLLGFVVLAGFCVASYAAQSLGGVMDDTLITTTVKTELAKDVRLGTLTGIEVNTTQGVVTLAGKVHTSEEKTMVEQKVKGVKGVVKVNNELQIVTP
jgi:osmotically-inducible protein OsmY